MLPEFIGLAISIAGNVPIAVIFEWVRLGNVIYL